jgi:hypothetical protein
MGARLPKDGSARRDARFDRADQRGFCNDIGHCQIKLVHWVYHRNDSTGQRAIERLASSSARAAKPVQPLRRIGAAGETRCDGDPRSNFEAPRAWVSE